METTAKRTTANWVAYCTACHVVLEECPNGNFADAHAKMHAEDTKHTVIVGYMIEVPATVGRS